MNDAWQVIICVVGQSGKGKEGGTLGAVGDEIRPAAVSSLNSIHETG